MDSTTQTVWRWLDAGDFPPPEKRRGPRYAPAGPCWLCGAPTLGVGWHSKDAIAPTFTDYALAACLPSVSVCQPCVALSRSEGWAQYVRRYPERGFAEHFPEKEGKALRAWNWLYLSHVFTPTTHETPSRARWRNILLAPPLPPFVFCLAVSGQKQNIFKARVNESRERFLIQADDDRLWIDRREFAECLADFEALYALGFSKDSILSGQYHHGQLLKVGLAIWRPLETRIAHWRAKPHVLWLAHYSAQRPKEIELPAQAPAKSPAPSGDAQFSLF